MYRERKNFTKNISSPEDLIKEWTSKAEKIWDWKSIETCADYTTNVGTEGSFIATFKHVEHVDLYEIDRQVYEQLLENIRQSPEDVEKKITPHNEDSTMGAFQYYHDLALIDPPWGGKEYKEGKDEEFAKYKVEINKICKKRDLSVEEILQIKKKLEIPIPLHTMDIGPIMKHGKTLAQLVSEIRAKYICVKMPLNQIQSPWSSDYVPFEGFDITIVNGVEWNQIKYVYALLSKKKVGEVGRKLGGADDDIHITIDGEVQGGAAVLAEPLGEAAIETGFINRFPKINLYDTHQIMQYLSMSNQHQKERLVKWLCSRAQRFPGKKVLYDENIIGGTQEGITGRNIVSQNLGQNMCPIDLNQPDKVVMEQIKNIIGGGTNAVQLPGGTATTGPYTRTREQSIGRAKHRAEQIRRLIQGFDIPDNPRVADIGSGDGVASKLIAAQLGAFSLDMYDPFVKELEMTPNELELDRLFPCKFHETTFDDVTEKYDIILLITALHHIANPEFIMQKIRNELNEGGVIIMREHRPKTELDKMYLDIEDKIYACGLTGEVVMDEEQMGRDLENVLKGNYEDVVLKPSAYFTEQELLYTLDTVNGKVVASMTEEEYELNGFSTYFLISI